MRAAVLHGMIGHLRRALADAGDDAPPGVVEAVDSAYRVNARRALRQTALLLKLVADLRAQGIGAMPFKGPAWAEWLYGDVAMRSWNDLDVLVRRRDALVVRDAVLARGFVDYNELFEPRTLVEADRGEGQLHFLDDRRKVILDVHWQVGVGQGADALDGDVLLDRAAPRSLLGQPVTGPSDADMLLILCVHGARHRWDTVEQLLGLAAFVRRVEPVAWPGLVAAAGAAGCRRRVTVAVAHVCRVFGLHEPAEVRRALDADPVGRWLLAGLRPEDLDLRPDGTLRHRRSSILWETATEDTTAACVRHAAARVLRPGPEDWESVTLPEGAAWLYYLVRPARLAGKWALILARRL